MDQATRRLLVGTDEAQPPELRLQAGPLSMRLVGTRLLSIHAGPHEVWHGVSFLFRDADWGTPEPVVDQIDHQPLAGGFRVDVRAHVPVTPRIDLHITVEGTDAGRVRYAGTATACGDIDTHRTGLCLMVPLSVIGRRVEVLHDDGRLSQSTFPRRIAPWPPFLSVRAIRHEAADGAWASAQLEGEVFELEDQRNNADASFKVYSRSNFMPRPYRLRAGQPVRQSVELQLAEPPALGVSRPAANRANAQAKPALRAGIGTGIGIGIEPADAAHSAALAPWLGQLAPRHLHLRIDAADSAAVHWAGIQRLLEAAGARLRLDITQLSEGGAAPTMAALAVALAAAGVRPESVTPFPSTPPVLEAARQAFPGSGIGGGTPYFFTQLNRLEGLGRVDHLSFCTRALVHGADDESVIAGLQCLPWMMETLAFTHPGVPVHLGPSAIGASASPLGAQPESDGSRRLALARHDPRSRALFGAAWLLGYVAACVQAGVAGLSLQTLLGPSGLLREHAGRLRPCPAFYALQALSQGQRWQASDSLQPLGVVCLTLGDAHATTLVLLANLGLQEASVGHDVIAPMLPTGASHTQLIDAAAWQAFEAGSLPCPWRSVHADGAPLCLPPLAIARLRR